MNMGKNRRWCWATLLLLAGCPQSSSEPAPVLTPPTVDAQPIAPATPAPVDEETKPRGVVEVSIGELPSAFSSEESEAFAKQHSNDDIVLTGYVSGFDVGWHPELDDDFIPSMPTVVLVGLRDASQPYSGINADLSKIIHSYTPGDFPWEKMGIGAQVTLRGRFATHRGFRFLDKCTIQSAAGDPPPQYTAPELVAALRSDFDKIDKAIGSLGAVVVSGKVKSVPKTPDERMMLVGEGDVDVLLSYVSANEAQFRDVKPGDQIAVIGSAILLALDEKTPVSINTCARIDKLDKK
jgi:hypothetical protein